MSTSLYGSEIVPTGWDHMSYPATWVWNVAPISWNDVNVQVGNRLTCNLANIYADVEGIRRVEPQDLAEDVRRRHHPNHSSLRRVENATKSMRIVVPIAPRPVGVAL